VLNQTFANQFVVKGRLRCWYCTKTAFYGYKFHTRR